MRDIKRIIFRDFDSGGISALLTLLLIGLSFSFAFSAQLVYKEHKKTTAEIETIKKVITGSKAVTTEHFIISPMVGKTPSAIISNRVCGAGSEGTVKTWHP